MTMLEVAEKRLKKLEQHFYRAFEDARESLDDLRSHLEQSGLSEKKEWKKYHIAVLYMERMMCRGRNFMYTYKSPEKGDREDD